VHFDLATLTVERLIIHEVPKHLRRDQSTKPLFSEVESPLNDELKSYFRDKIVNASGSTSAYAVIFGDNSTSPIPPLVTDFLTNPTADFLGMSKTMAKHLHNVQDGTNSGGLVTVIDCKMKLKKQALSILKLEKEEGVRLRQTTQDGKRTFDVRYLRDLILTEKNRLFKIGFFLLDDDGEPLGKVCDEQRGYRPRIGVATFFLSTFLGCSFLDDPRVSTKTFFDAAQDFINEQIEDPEQRTKAINHLISDLSSNKSTVNIRSFARDYLPTDKAQQFEDYIHQTGIAGKTIRKDLALIENQLRKVSIEFDDISVVGAKDAIEKNVKVKKAGQGMTKAEIVGRLRRVRPKGLLCSYSQLR